MIPHVPQNAYWYELAYTITVVGYLAYTVSLWWRRRALERALRRRPIETTQGTESA